MASLRPTLVTALALALVVLAATWLGAQTAMPIAVPPLVDRPGLTGGLNNLELSPRGHFRWTEDTTWICAPFAGHAARTIVELRLAGEYALALGVAEARLQANVGPPVVIALVPDLRRYQILSGGDWQPGAASCALISVDAVDDPNNNRRLGVPFYGFTTSRLPLAGPIMPAPSQLLINLALALLALALLRLLGVPALVAALVVATGAAVPALLLVTDLLPAGPGRVTLQLPLLAGLAAAAIGLLVARAAEPWPPGLRMLAVLVFWSGVLVGGVRLVQAVNGHSSVWPLKAGFDPNLTPLVLLPAALCAGWLWLLLREPLRVPGLRVALLLAGAVALPVALEVSVLGWDALYAVFRDSPYDYLRDTPAVGGDPLGFVRRYVALAPDLALHSSTHPPGSILLLWLVEQLAGPGPVATSWAAIMLSALLPMAALWLGWRLGGPRLGLLAGAICTLMPGHMIYAVTSMDGVFNALNALGAVAFFLALEPPARPRVAMLAGALLALALFFTYATTQLFFFGLAAAAIALVRYPGWPSLWRIVRQGALAAGVIALAYLLLYLLTGFDVVYASSVATAENARAMGRWLYGQTERPFIPPSVDYYLIFLGANMVAYVWYLAPWGLAALDGVLLAHVRRGWRQVDVYGALLVATGAGVLGMWLSGLFNREVERIWGYTYPLAAVLIAHHALSGDERARRWLPWLYPGLFFALSAAFKLLLNTVW